MEDADAALPDASAEAVLAALEAEEAESPDMHFLDAPSEAAGEAQRLQVCRGKHYLLHCEWCHIGCRPVKRKQAIKDRASVCDNYRQQHYFSESAAKPW